MEYAKPANHTECISRLSSIDDALYVIGGKWKIRVIVALKEGSKRFNEVQRAISGISARVLSGELKDLEMNGFVKRLVHDKTPVVVEYQLTDYADSLGDILQSLYEWGHKHRDKIRMERKMAAGV
ncbi:helix-turn-helix domain-containing protein [Ferruginibacter sp. HRS2-29]|uniref:winged helix-turn-helix transcriptional regulator n=1 Tax=Ferruginibacter sp. HRS2-29 TaxID=2487334 RepID=UPI0020CC46F8|nr:helix-turn-helix domain-containing protein [Ferruginibacter sp. HRS2-29]MCP9751484.1 transcriptional regulator [Ferruginibacter sp. HRS2-29]MCP9751525.1 transcriptional regulator [Ferruginibacter sp. HRS2-29]MCP9751527.1 transcriptional regulator [Ferruginibacter sp. HRS2-29]MCP9751993.1 transcriptional regulator [Ferruginibacter sp. HRS2-29]